jgi:hypothetical protein
MSVNNGKNGCKSGLKLNEKLFRGDRKKMEQVEANELGIRVSTQENKTWLCTYD